MPKDLVTKFIDTRTPKKRKRKRKKRKVDYTEYLQPPTPVEDRCVHSLKAAVRKSDCSQCLGVVPRVTLKPVYGFWLIDEVSDWTGDE